MDLGISTNPTPELYTIKVTGEIDISNADSLRNADGRTHRKPDNHNGQHMHDLRADRHRRGCRNALELPDDEQIRHTVERL